MKAIVTGGAGFIAHHLVQYLLNNTDWDLVIIDKLSYASFGLERLREIRAFDIPRVLTLVVDFSHRISRGVIKEMVDAEYVFHLGAESHVDNSVLEPEMFVKSNVLGTMHILDMARKLPNLKQFVYFSTDEVFGPALDFQKFTPYDRYNSRNPYSATKAGGEELAWAYADTYKLPVLVLHCSNVFGVRQHPEKFIPLVIKKLLNNEVIQIHADPTLKKIGSRNYIHASDVADAFHFLVDGHQWRRNKFNIPGQLEIDNLSLAEAIAGMMGRELGYEIVGFRLGEVEHDLRYSIDGSTLIDLGWNFKTDFIQKLKETVEWTAKRTKWLES